MHHESSMFYSGENPSMYIICGVVPCMINSEAQSPWSDKLSLLSQY